MQKKQRARRGRGIFGNDVEVDERCRTAEDTNETIRGEISDG